MYYVADPRTKNNIAFVKFNEEKRITMGFADNFKSHHVFIQKSDETFIMLILVRTNV